MRSDSPHLHYAYLAYPYEHLLQYRSDREEKFYMITAEVKNKVGNLRHIIHHF